MPARVEEGGVRVTRTVPPVCSAWTVQRGPQVGSSSEVSAVVAVPKAVEPE